MPTRSPLSPRWSTQTVQGVSRSSAELFQFDWICDTAPHWGSCSASSSLASLTNSVWLRVWSDRAKVGHCTLMQHSYLTLLSAQGLETRAQRLESKASKWELLCGHCVGFRIQSQNFKTFKSSYVTAGVLLHSNRSPKAGKRPGRSNTSAVACQAWVVATRWPSLDSGAPLSICQLPGLPPSASLGF